MNALPFARVQYTPPSLDLLFHVFPCGRLTCRLVTFPESSWCWNETALLLHMMKGMKLRIPNVRMDVREAARTGRTKPPGGIIVQNLFPHRRFAPDTYSVRPLFQAIQCRTEFVQHEITLEGKDCIELMNGNTILVKDLFGPIETVILFQMFKELRQYNPPH